MSNKSNINGRAYEFAFLSALKMEIANHHRSVKIIGNDSFYSAEQAFGKISDINKRLFTISAISAIHELFKLEPRILESADDDLELCIQPDSAGKIGDVRDILISRKNISWEIGLSLKHNHFAVKHNRLSPKIDFGKQWYGVPCSEQYWQEIKPVFSLLAQKKTEHINFNDIQDKDEKIYIPTLKAFINEIKRQSIVHPDIPKKLIGYLLSKYDFYKIISIDKERTAHIHCFHIYGSLNQDGVTQQPDIEVPIVELPTRIVAMDFKPESTTTIELYMDGGWQFSFRIHNGDKIACTSLKFDIQIIGMPTTILTINCLWS